MNMNHVSVHTARSKKVEELGHNIQGGGKSLVSSLTFSGYPPTVVRMIMVLERCRAAGYINRQSSHDMLFGRQSNFGRHLKGRLKLCSKQYNLFKLGPFEQTWVSEKYVSVAAPKSIHFICSLTCSQLL